MFAPAASAASASCEDALQRALHPGRPLGDGPRDVERVRLEDRGAHLAQLLELGVEQDRVVDHELARVLGRLVEQVPLRADARLHAHHDRLADRVDRRVRHLREELLEVRVEERLAVGEHGERRVVPHRADRLLGVPRERREDHVHVLLRVAERELAVAQRLARRGLRLRLGQIGEPHRLLRRTSGRTAAGAETSRLISSSSTILPRSRSTRNSLPGWSRPFRTIFSGGSSSTPVSEAMTTQPSFVSYQRPGRRPLRSSVAPISAAVREGDRGRSVPRLHQALVVRVEALQLVGQVVAALVRLRDHHHHRVRERAAREQQQLEHVVEHRRVRSGRANDRQHLAEVVAEELGRELRLARAHPVDVALQPC